MEKNIGSTDRILRIVAGLIIMIVGAFYGSWWGLIGIIPLATAFMQWCPLYVPFGLSTRKSKQAH